MSARRTYLRKLVPDQIRLIRLMHANKLPRKLIAKSFQISLTALQHILAGSTYKDIR